MSFLKSYYLSVGEDTERELLLKILVKPDSDAFLVFFGDNLRIKVNANAFMKLQSEEEWVSDLVSDVWRRKIVDEAIDVWGYLFLIDLDCSCCCALGWIRLGLGSRLLMNLRGSNVQICVDSRQIKGLYHCVISLKTFLSGLDYL